MGFGNKTGVFISENPYMEINLISLAPTAPVAPKKKCPLQEEDCGRGFPQVEEVISVLWQDHLDSCPKLPQNCKASIIFGAVGATLGQVLGQFCPRLAPPGSAVIIGFVFYISFLGQLGQVKRYKGKKHGFQK